MAKTEFELGNHTNTEKYLKHAIKMVPHKFYSLYLLAKLYKDMGYKKKALTVARKLSDMNIKVASSTILDMKKEMQFLLDSPQVQL